MPWWYHYMCQYMMFVQCRMVYSEYKQYIINVIFWNLDSPSVITSQPRAKRAAGWS